MIATLRGTIGKQIPNKCTVDVNGVGYAVSVPLNVWEALEEGKEVLLHISPYIREDRFDLYGFLDAKSKTFFERLIDLQGIGPRTGLELCAVPRLFLLQAIHEQDPKILLSVKGIGKKTAEKLLVDLKSLMEKQPELFEDPRSPAGLTPLQIDHDAIDALTQLGFTAPVILRALQDLPKDLTSTEERITAVLRSL